jgi:hypothetical protein
MNNINIESSARGLAKIATNRGNDKSPSSLPLRTDPAVNRERQNRARQGMRMDAGLIGTAVSTIATPLMEKRFRLNPVLTLGASVALGGGAAAGAALLATKEQPWDRNKVKTVQESAVAGAFGGGISTYVNKLATGAQVPSQLSSVSGLVIGGIMTVIASADPVHSLAFDSWKTVKSKLPSLIHLQ